MPHDAERLYAILSSPEFLQMRGLGNEVPLFIQPYPPEREDAERQMVRSLTARLRACGVSVTLVDLFDLVLEELEDAGYLERVLEREKSMGKDKLFDLLCNLSDPSTRLVPRLVKRMEGEEAQVTLLTGAGRVYPFLRTHTLLESLQPAMPQHPVVLFFPGEYLHEEGIGSQLRLFGSKPGSKLYKPYYRAFNLDDYQV